MRRQSFNSCLSDSSNCTVDSNVNGNGSVSRSKSDFEETNAVPTSSINALNINGDERAEKSTLLSDESIVTSPRKGQNGSFPESSVLARRLSEGSKLRPALLNTNAISQPNFLAGDAVSVNWMGGKRRGTVAMRNRNGTFQVELEDGTVVKTVSVAALERVGHSEFTDKGVPKMDPIDIGLSVPPQKLLDIVNQRKERPLKISATSSPKSGDCITKDISGIDKLEQKIPASPKYTHPPSKFDGSDNMHVGSPFIKRIPSRKRSVSFGPRQGFERNHLRDVLRKSAGSSRSLREGHAEFGQSQSASPVIDRSKSFRRGMLLQKSSGDSIFNILKRTFQRTSSEALQSLKSSPKSVQGKRDFGGMFFGPPVLNHTFLQNTVNHDDNLTDLEEPVFDSPFKFNNGKLNGSDFDENNQDIVESTQKFPYAVDRYIENRIEIERQMSATGPKCLPKRLHSNNPFESKPFSTLVLSNKIAGASLETTQSVPFTEALFKEGVSETPHSTKLGIILEGWLQKYSPESVKGCRWHARYCVLYAGTCELRYYRSCQDAAWGRIPVGERGSIPLRLLVQIEQPSKAKWKGCRFDLVVRHRGVGRYPGIQIRPGKEHLESGTKVYKFSTDDPQQRLLWCTMISSFMKSIGQTQSQSSILKNFDTLVDTSADPYKNEALNNENVDCSEDDSSLS